MVYQDVMAGKQCHNASDFVALIRDKKTSIIVDELLISDIEAAHEYLTSLFQDLTSFKNRGIPTNHLYRVKVLRTENKY
ncbi:unnamed protein product, partial [Rotaria socialis]